MILTSEQTLNLIKENKYKTARIYQGHLPISDLKGAPLFEEIKTDSPDLLVKRIEEIRNLFGGNFTLSLGHGSERNMRGMAKINVSFTQDSHSSQMKNISQQFTHTDKSTIIAEAKAEFKKELESQQKEQEIKDMRAELKELKTWGGKTSLIVEHFIKTYLTTGNITSVMQGTGNDSSQKKVDLTDLESALSDLIEALGQDVIIKLAAKLKTKKGASMIPLIKNFAN